MRALSCLHEVSTTFTAACEGLAPEGQSIVSSGGISSTLEHSGLLLYSRVMQCLIETNSYSTYSNKTKA